ncbi:hypothetical protein C8Q80DRAFT_1204494 [Daedaleopsis nitida]|nr:hypothetical protein C8Q80DRAFT_1204494 [Daedaleopsis nitida]
MDIINRQPPSRGRSATPAASVSIPSSVSTSRSPSRPPSSISGGDTSENEESQEPLNILEGAGPGASSTIANVSDALRYRAKTYHPAFAAPDEYVNSGTNHPLTKIVTPSRIPGEPGPDTSSTSTKKSRKRTGKGGGSESVPGAGNTDSSESKSVTLRLIPQSMQALFTERFVPLTRQFAGTLDPWQEVTLNELKTLYLQAFGNLAQVHPLQEGDKCHKLIQQKLNDWRAKFATTGGETFKEIIASDPNLVEWFTDPDNVGAYATYLLGDGKGAAPFYYAEWNEGVQKIGRMRSALIVGIFAHHISELHAINSKERTGDIPRGALCMAVLAAIHTLTHYQTGQWAPPSGRAGWFSADNYSDRMYWDANRQRERSDKKVTNILKVIDDLSGDEWFDIIEEARKVLITRRATSGRRSKAGKGKSAAVLQAEEVQSEGVAASDSDSDNGLMLVNDA